MFAEVFVTAPMKKVLVAVGICIAAVPAAIVGTLALIPFWRWFEVTTGIESIGHSGPSDWCFAAIFGVLVFVSFGAWIFVRSKPSAGR